MSVGILPLAGPGTGSVEVRDASEVSERSRLRRVCDDGYGTAAVAWRNHGHDGADLLPSVRTRLRRRERAGGQVTRGGDRRRARGPRAADGRGDASALAA